MKRLLFCLTLTTVLLDSRTTTADEYQPKLFSSVELIYEDEFTKEGPLDDGKHWVVRQNTQWSVVDGVLTGTTAPVEFQKKMQAIGDGHDGTRPVIFLRPVPQALVVQLRVRYNETEKKGRNRGSLLDFGHHVNSFIFAESQTKVTLQKKKKLFLEGEFFPLNQWNLVTIELTEGSIYFKVNERSELIRDPLITLRSDREFQQIDFKGQDFGSVQIDWVKLYRGVR